MKVRMSNKTTGRYLAVWLGLVGIAIATCNLVGCSGQDAGSPTSGPEGVDEIVLSLSQGASRGDVETRLGEPVFENTYGREAIVGYPPWQLRFQDGKLQQRVREVRGARTSLPERILDRKVLLRVVPGMTVGAVKKILGAPEVYEQIYESGRKPAVVLRYAYWELYFRKGRLVRRTQN
jgi:outer membrane protein assembly factor BamE (lipoprotein component of BamABCDE complex)